MLSAFVGIINLAGFPWKIQKPRSTFEPTSEKVKLFSDILLMKMQPVVLEKNKFDYKEKPKLDSFLPILAYGDTNADNMNR